MDLFLYLAEIVILGIVTGAIIWFYRKITYWDRVGIPNTGFFFQFFAYKNRQGGDVEIEIYQKYGPIYGTYIFLSPILIVGSESHMKDIMIKDFNNFRNHSPFPVIDRRLSHNPFFSRDEYWKKLRGIITPIFSSASLKSLATDVMSPSIDTFISNMMKFAKDGSVISIKKYFDCLLMDIMVSCVYGVKIDCLNEPNNAIVTKSSQIFKAIMDSLGFSGSLFVDKSCFDYIAKLTMDLVIQRRKENLEGGGVKTRTDFLQVLTDAKYQNTLTDDEICGFGISFFTSEMTSTTMTGLAYFLATNQHVQHKLYEEISQFGNEELNFDTVSGFKYLDGVIKETLRMWTSGYRLDRLAEEDYKLEGTNMIIPKGMSVQIPLYAIQHDPNYYPQPKQFKPERFIFSEQNPSPPPFLTFGAGPRICVAQRFATLNIKLTIAKLLNIFKFEATPDTKLESIEGEKLFVFTKDVYLKIVQR